jgi:hypothetical protein
MRRKLTWAVLCIAAVGVVAIYNAESARATPASGFSGQNLMPFTATFGEFQVFNHLTKDQLKQLAPAFPGDTWLSFQKTQGPSDLYLQSNTWQLGGSTGWAPASWSQPHRDHVGTGDAISRRLYTRSVRAGNGKWPDFGG